MKKYSIAVTCWYTILWSFFPRNRFRSRIDLQKQTNRRYSWVYKGCGAGYEYIEKFWGEFSWYMMESLDFISEISFKLKNDKGHLMSFNGQSIKFRLSINEVQFFQMHITLIKSRYQIQSNPKIQKNIRNTK